jgi:hypothetical protein
MRSMLPVFELIAAVCAALFAGAALYINVAEHPARMGLETRVAVLQWAPSYQLATWMQLPLALLSFVGGVAAWLMRAGLGWLVAAALIGLVVPFTLIGIMPTNHKLLEPGRDLSYGAGLAGIHERLRQVSAVTGRAGAKRPTER